MPKPIVWIIDTSVLLNILKHPSRAQQQAAVNTTFRERLKAGHRFAVPLTTIIETGNWAYKMDAGLRAAWAQQFSRFVGQSLAGRAPFEILNFPAEAEVADYLTSFPTFVDTMGFGDYLIRKQWEALCAAEEKYRGFQINVWSLDGPGLEGLECNH